MARTPDQQARLDRFCEHVAEGANISEAGRREGMKQNAANQLWLSVKRQMGEQAR